MFTEVTFAIPRITKFRAEVISVPRNSAEVLVIDDLCNFLFSVTPSLPDGSVILFGSLSQLRLGGVFRYASACVKGIRMLEGRLGSKFLT